MAVLQRFGIYNGIVIKTISTKLYLIIRNGKIRADKMVYARARILRS